MKKEIGLTLIPLLGFDGEEDEVDATRRRNLLAGTPVHLGGIAGI